MLQILIKVGFIPSLKRTYPLDLEDALYIHPDCSSQQVPIA